MAVMVVVVTLAGFKWFVDDVTLLGRCSSTSRFHKGIMICVVGGMMVV